MPPPVTQPNLMSHRTWSQMPSTPSMATRPCFSSTARYLASLASSWGLGWGVEDGGWRMVGGWVGAVSDDDAQRVGKVMVGGGWWVDGWVP